MKILNTLVPVIVAMLTVPGITPAEMREWMDADGKTVNAEFVRKEVESVVLRTEDGTELKVAYNILSEEDRQYVMLQTPPRLEIRVEPNVRNYTVGYLGNDGYDYTVKYEVVEPRVFLRRTSTHHYDAELILELVILGRIREIDRYLVIDNSKTPFSFTGRTSYEYTYAGYPLDLQQIRGSWRSGVEYKGYLVAVRDSRGVLIASKASWASLQENADEVMAAEIGSMLTDDLQVIQPRRIMPDSGFEQPQLTF
jgi:hypothetical protein